MLDRFIQKVRVDKLTGCWIWEAVRDWKGYGQFYDGTAMRKAHRMAWFIFVSDIPEGMQIDHKCRVRHCVNPGHLELVTPKENIRRGNTGKWKHDASARHIYHGKVYGMRK